ncbi:hypothetical protein GE061_007363 [Apolygus lucorum]|uniref:Uncharacterized protein n=1 Tax=Apolygus lucorum TaxID=248454 RepID=A0A8S9WRP8_APOLU|nr:hypothetical protein GE061_007363 [Apolygus lucorum]
MSRKSNAGGGRKSVARKSVARKSVARKSLARKSNVGGKRKSSVGRKSSKGGGGVGGATTDAEKAKMRHPMYYIKQYLNNPENLESHYAFYRELLQKKDDLVNDCLHGRKRFVDWLAMFLRAEGLVVETREMPAQPLDIYGPDGPPPAVLAYPLAPDPSRWTMCIFGRYEQVEERIKDPALLFNGRICYRRRPPETWGVLATWLATFKALSVTRQPLPVNIKMCFTALQSDDAPTMVKFIESIKKEFLRFVDFFAYATTLSVTTLPGGIAYSGRGVCHFVMDISDGNPAPEICSSLTGPLRQTAHDAVYLLDDLEKDCVYSHLNMFEDFILPHRFLKLVRRVYVRDLQPIKGFFYRKKVLEVKEKRAEEMWRPAVSLQDIQAFSQHVRTPGIQNNRR